MKQRLNLSLSPELHKVLAELSEKTSTPKATIVAKIVEELLPQFELLLDAVEVVKKHPNDAIDLGKQYVKKALSESQQFSDDLRAEIEKP